MEVNKLRNIQTNIPLQYVLSSNGDEAFCNLFDDIIYRTIVQYARIDRRDKKRSNYYINEVYNAWRKRKTINTWITSEVSLK